MISRVAMAKVGAIKKVSIAKSMGDDVRVFTPKVDQDYMTWTIREVRREAEEGASTPKEPKRPGFGFNPSGSRGNHAGGNNYTPSAPRGNHAGGSNYTPSTPRGHNANDNNSPSQRGGRSTGGRGGGRGGGNGPSKPKIPDFILQGTSLSISLSVIALKLTNMHSARRSREEETTRKPDLIDRLQRRNDYILSLLGFKLQHLVQEHFCKSASHSINLSSWNQASTASSTR